MRIQPVAIVLVALAVVLLVVSVIYLTKTADNLPSFMGKPTAQQLRLPICDAKKALKACRTPRKYTKRGIAAGGLAAVALVGAWYTSGLRKSSSGSSSSRSSDTPAA